MTFRTRVVLLGSAAFILSMTLVLGLLFPPDGGMGAGASERWFPGFKADSAREIEISGKNGGVLLRRTGQEWVLETDAAAYPASKKRVEDLLGEVSTLARGAFVTGNAETAAELGLGENAVELKIKGEGNKTICDIHAGKTGVTGRGRYLKENESSMVYETGGSLAPYLNPEAGFWARMRLFPEDLKEGDIEEIKVASSIIFDGGRPGRPLDYELVRSEGRGGVSWAVVDGGTRRILTAEKAIGFLESVLGFEAQDIDEEAVRKVRDDRKAAVTLRTLDGRTFTLLVGKAEGDRYPCAVSGLGLGYAAAQWRLREVLATPDSLVRERP